MLKKIPLSFIIAIGLIYASFVFSVQAQTGAARGFKISDKPMNCESNLARMEQVAFLTFEQTENGGVLIVIARLGYGEKSREINQRRLYNAREKLKERGVSAEKILVAEGEPIEGFGRVEFYLSGKLVGGLLAERNQDLCVECCGDYKLYYPEKEIYERQQKQKRKRRG